MTYKPNRRSLLKHTAYAGLAAAGLTATGCAVPKPDATEGLQTPPWPSDTTLLFQGDSITDAGRKKSNTAANHADALGRGYALMAGSQLLAEPTGSRLSVYNRGVSGNKVFQLAERWDEDCIQLKPDVLSILIGVNDIWHTLVRRYDGTVEVYEQDFLALLERTRQALPETRLIVCEPFVLRCGAVDDTWFPEFNRYRAAAQRVAQQAEAVFVPFQSVFNQALSQAPAEHWTADGVHPTAAGSYLMAQAWLGAVKRSRG